MADRRSRARQVFLEAIGQPPGQREAFLERACAGEPELLVEVKSLLAADADPLDLAGVINRGMEGAGRREPELTGSVGPFRIIERLGEGGFADVYLAEQRTPVRRTVALKVVKPGMDSRAVLARFESERQALAMLDHPNIARIYDGGVTDQGRPYFVMERVRGLPITRHCDQGRLTIAERLDLFMDVCNAVQHAHQKGIIHRDLKPGNILVETIADRPVSKVIDFGIAKAMGGRLTDLTLATESGQFMGTPGYMSPEQTGALAMDVDTRSDVYSLGVLLYELLTGALPFETSQCGSLADLQRLLCEHDPIRPSTRLTQSEASSVAAARRTDPATLRRSIRGDLDWITMKATERDRTRRYESVGALAADIRCMLAQLPVSAGPPTATYRLRKFVRRHRAGVGAAVGGVAILLAAIALIGVISARESRLRLEAEAARDELAEVTQFQARMLANVEPAELGNGIIGAIERAIADRARDRGMTDSEKEAAIREFATATAEVSPADVARDVLDTEILPRAIRALEESDARTPYSRGALRLAIADVYREIDLLDRAIVEYQKAMSHLRETQGEQGRLTLRAMDHLGLAHKLNGQFEKALRYYRRAFEGRRRRWGIEDPDTLVSVSNIGALLRASGRIDEAQWYYETALRVRRRTLPPDHPDLLTSINNMARLRVEQGLLEEALELNRESLDRHERRYGRDHEETLFAISNLGRTYFRLGRLEEAEPYLVEALKGRRRLRGNRHRETITSINNLADLYRAQGRYDLAEPLAREVHKVVLAEHGQRNWRVGVTLAGIADILHHQGEVDRAIDDMTRAIDIIDASRGEQSVLAGRLRLGRAEILASMRSFERAIDDLELAFAAFREEGNRRLEQQAVEAALTVLNAWGESDPAGKREDVEARWRAREAR